MKLSLIPLIIFSLASFSAMSEVTKDDLSAIKQLVKDQQYEKALEKHVWFHEESKFVTGLSGVRLVYALNDWVELGQLYPPAIVELEKLRDAKAGILKAGKGTYDVYREYFAINRAMDEQNKTVDLFKYIYKNFPKQAESYYFTTEELLIEHNEIALVEQYISDPIYKYEVVRHRREFDLSQARREEKRTSLFTIEYANEHYVRETQKLINVLKKLNRLSEAEEVFNRSQAYFANEEIRDTFLN